jgi:membrane protein
MGEQVKRLQPNTFGHTSRSAWLLLKALPQVFRQASNDWVNDNAQRLGASVAFYTLLSLAPLIVIAIAVAAFFFGQHAAQGRLAWEIRDVAGTEVAGKIQEIIKGAYTPRTSVVASLLGVATLLFAASSVFVELHDAMNIIWHVPAPPGQTGAALFIRLIKDRFYSVATVLGTGFLLLVSLALEAGIAAMRISVPRFAIFIASYLLIAVLFAAIYKIVPDVRLKWSDVAPGAIIASLLFVIGKQVMGLYFAHANFGSTYNAAGSPIVVLLWVYYSAQLFFWGTEFTKVYKNTLESLGDEQQH